MYSEKFTNGELWHKRLGHLNRKVDDYSRKVFLYFLQNKSEVTETFKNFKSLVENQTGNQTEVTTKAQD
ncbi:hypothetical protein QE152_g5433 [Popillia japonica]|uniref:GAG-pre-integrase domain-containing protein n=1 Tax=Popillia japonica TaxID=7064 RepID=A0AAW1MMV4_POPJA